MDYAKPDFEIYEVSADDKIAPSGIDTDGDTD